MKEHDFFRKGEDFKTDRLHYKLCGLDNIYLLNGFEYENHDGEPYLVIRDLDGLHKAIGLHIVMRIKTPSGAELRFLRREMDMSQAQLAKILSISPQTVARWEKGQTEIPGATVFALKCFYLMSLLPSTVFQDFKQRIEELSETDDSEDASAPLDFAYENDAWSDRCAA